MRRTNKMILMALAGAALLWGMTVNGSLAVLGTLTASVVDFGSATATVPARKGAGAPSGVCGQGEMYFRTDSLPGQNLYICTAADTWAATGGGGSAGKGLVEPRYIQVSEDFGVPAASVTGNSTWRGSASVFSFTGSGNFGAYQAGAWPNVGIARLSSGSGAAGHLNQSDISGSVAWGTLPTTSTWKYYLVFKFPAAADYDAAATTWIGLGGISGSPPNGFGIRRTGAETNWQLYFKSGDGTQATDSGWVAADTNWHTLKFASDGTAANKVWVSMDGGTAKSICVSGCDANAGAGWWGNPTLNGFYMYQTATSGNTRNLVVDYFGFEGEAGATSGRRN